VCGRVGVGEKVEAVRGGIHFEQNLKPDRNQLHPNLVVLNLTQP